ncbi:hypothetical protein BCR42DRAFT_427113 [Absidia repens]|uniref:Heterokaryon incompatibility domain-containing protein n=1 Tax=Absidia repens TaxID=90262 RepID=A0A1X2HZW9_9FUNG|nr:hypothetical protein BCR42DRAFT_427113 [Absidia repens]
MTREDQVEQCFEQLSCNDRQQQPQKPLHIVLVDIKKTEKSGKIHCVEKSLEDDLKYVALSYRWGELQETLVDTGVGYIASITSFDIKDFIQLCKLISLESDLKHMDYVWVDAICVNQTNHAQRKATIYQMSNIYEKANYILAVPDLNLQHLKDTNTKNNNVIEGSSKYYDYIYHLIHGNTEQLTALDENFFKHWNITPSTRKWLINHTNFFTPGFMKQRQHSIGYSSEEALDHIYQVSQASSEITTKTMTTDERKLLQEPFTLGPGGMIQSCDIPEPPEGFHCEGTYCQLHLSEFAIDRQPIVPEPQWNHAILERNTAIQQSMELFCNLIVDWSSRVWVISEYSIAKKKNNLKYWFVQLAPEIEESLFEQPIHFYFCGFDFNQDDNDDPLLSGYTDPLNDLYPPLSDPVYPKFHATMIKHLKERSFLEMILKSKASRCEDRLYAVLPLSKYKDQPTNQSLVDEEGRCQVVNNLTSLKLKLFQWMDTKDRLDLLFLAGNNASLHHDCILPTFATTTIPCDRYPVQYLEF